MDNIPSISKIEYITPDGISQFDYSPGETIDISSHLTGSFTELSISGTASLNGQAKKSDAGVLYEVSCSARKAGKSAANFQTLNTLSSRQHIFRLTDANGQKYLIGTKENPAKLEFNDVNDGEPTGSRGYTFDISWQSITGIIYLA